MGIECPLVVIFMTSLSYSSNYLYGENILPKILKRLPSLAMNKKIIQKVRCFFVGVCICVCACDVCERVRDASSAGDGRPCLFDI